MPPRDREFLTQRFADLQGRVKIDYFHQTDSTVTVPGRRPCPTCAPTKEALEELASLSDRIDLAVHEFSESRELADKRKIERVPGIVVRGEINRPVRLMGMPGGVLLPLLVQAILSVSSKPSDPPGNVKATLRKLRKLRHLRVLGAMMDPATGDAAVAAIALALASPRIEVSIYNLDEFPDLGMQIGLRHTPATLVDDHGFAGVSSPSEIARYLYDLEAHPNRANLRPPATAPGSAHPWRPPQPPQAEGVPPTQPGPPRPPGPRAPQRDPTAPPGMRRTPGGLIVPNR